MVSQIQSILESGRWKKISKDGSDYTLEEKKKLGDDGKYDGAFVIKEGGSAVVMDASGQNQELEWKETDKGISSWRERIRIRG
ncbi:MAG: hypothetical protein ACLSG9_05835 [Eubacterium sp.]